MKCHTGGVVTFRRGAVTSKSSNKKSNMKSSSEGKVICMNNYVAFLIWFRYFIDGEGYEVTKNVVYQDNQSAIKIKKNRLQSWRKKQGTL